RAWATERLGTCQQRIDGVVFAEVRKAPSENRRRFRRRPLASREYVKKKSIWRTDSDCRYLGGGALLLRKRDSTTTSPHCSWAGTRADITAETHRARRWIAAVLRGAARIPVLAARLAGRDYRASIADRSIALIGASGRSRFAFGAVLTRAEPRTGIDQ